MNQNKGKAVFFVYAGIISAVVLAAAVFFGVRANMLSSQLSSKKTECEKTDKENLEIKNNYNKLKEDNARLQLDLQRMAQEKDNVSAQVRGLLSDRNLARELEASVAKLKKDMEILTQEKQEFLDRSLVLKEKIKDLESVQKATVKERDQLKQDLTKERDRSGIKKLEQENASLKKENSSLAVTLNEARKEAEKLSRENSRLNDGLKEANEKLNKFSKDYDEAVKKNRALEKRAIEAPGKFAELARQNKILIKQTANMHYNLGVFYTKSKEYSRAAAEFEKAIELSPDDAYSHFNLGYIYAEYLVDRTRAIEHFRQYLRLAKSDDKDVDWVKNYILTWQTWEGKKPME
ncbi:MAG: tetratricopeptide repeat protein [Candidatus Omnitrophota bacterium]